MPVPKSFTLTEHVNRQIERYRKMISATNKILHELQSRGVTHCIDNVNFFDVAEFDFTLGPIDVYVCIVYGTEAEPGHITFKATPTNEAVDLGTTFDDVTWTENDPLPETVVDELLKP